MEAPAHALTRTRVHFRTTGFFAYDARITFAIDGAPLGEGTLLAGAAFEVALAPGAHVLVGTLKSGLVTRRRRWRLEVPALPADAPNAVFDVRVGYSRLWGNFDQALGTRVAADVVPLGELTAPEGPVTPDGAVVATWALIAVLFVCFVAEFVFGIGPSSVTSPSIHTLVGLGGLDVANTTGGQWFRLVSATFLHADALHLLFNAVAIGFGGHLIERTVGPRWFLVLYMTGGIAGSVASLALNDGHVVSVGASGAALSLFGAGLFIAGTLPRPVRVPTRLNLARVLVPSLIPFATQGGRVDVGAHLGGLLAGLALGALLLAGVRRAERRSGSALAFRRSRLALAPVFAFAFALPLTVLGVVRTAYPEARALAALEAALLPNDELTADAAPSSARITDWRERYPDDPRVLLFAADAARDDEDWDAVDEAVARGREGLTRFSALFEERALAAFRGGFDEIERDAAVRRRLLPNKELPTGTPASVGAAWDANLPAWLERFPDDPRLHERAVWTAPSTEEMAAHVEQGLAHLDTFAGVLSRADETRAWLHYGQALVLLDREREEEARAVLAALCDGAPSEAASHARERGDCP